MDFSRTELLEIKDLVTSALESAFMGDYEGFDLAQCDPKKFDLDLGEALRLQSVLRIIRNKVI